MKKLLLTLLTILSLQLQAQCWKEVASGLNHTLAIKTDGTLWGWGDHSHSQLGLTGSLPNQNIYQISTDTNWKMVSAGWDTSMAIKTDGTLWGWGRNYNGEVGTGNTEIVQVPTQIGTDTDWVYISSKANHTAAIKADGTLWTWGNNYYLQVGHSMDPNFHAPTKIGTDTDWKTTSVSPYNTFAIKTNGTLWVWGTNASGVFGNGTAPYFGQEGYSSLNPVQIGSDTDWDIVSPGAGHVAAIKNNGTLWTWGRNDKGVLGNGLTTDSYLPTQVGTATWKSVNCTTLSTFFPSCGAISTEGILYMWGTKEIGQFESGATTSLNIPTALNTDFDWKTIILTSHSVFAIKNDQTLYSWGDNGAGQLGHSNENLITSPQLVNCNVLSIKKQEALTPITIHPNPTTGILNLENTNNLNIEKLTIIDVTGKTLLEQKSNTSQIDVQQLPAGMYFLEITTNGSKQHTKFIKE